jgi:hypothetical protein
MSTAVASVTATSYPRRMNAAGLIVVFERAAKLLAGADLTPPEAQAALVRLGRDPHLMRLLMVARLAHHDQGQRLLAQADAYPAASAAFSEDL